MQKFMLKLALAAPLLATVPMLGFTPAVQACGGFFCQTVPIDQAAERILFVKDGDEMVAHVQIQYTGPSENFSWVVPVPTPPKLSVGSDQLFQTLRNTTRPQFNLNIIRTEGTCRQDVFADGAFGGSPTSAAAPASRSESAVDVISQEEVGPYESAVIQSDSPEAIKKWLKDNGYDVPASVDPLLKPYIDKEMPLLALKLRKDRSAGDLQPIVMRYKADQPMIPIQLTAVAATPDMDVQVWILGQNRAVPINYPHVEINEVRLNWQQSGNNYRQLVTEAMNEAGGRGFVTDYAGESAAVPQDQIDPSQYNLESLRNLSDPLEFARTAQGFFVNNNPGGPGRPVFAPTSPNNGAYISFLGRHIAKPASLSGLSDAEFYSRLEEFASALKEANVRVDTAKAINELNETLVKPLEDVQRLFKTHPYLTALFTTLSPEEMTVDPMFNFNTKMKNVSAMREAEGVRLCSRDVSTFEAPIRITTPSGMTYTFKPNLSQPVSSQGATLPAAARIQLLQSDVTAATGMPNNQSSEPELIKDNTAQINAQVGSQTPVSIGSDGTVQTAQEGFGCACHSPNASRPATDGAGEGVAYILGIAGYLGWRRRKKNK